MSTSLDNTQRPYLSAYVICVQDGKIALVLRENTGWMNGYWCLLSGKVEHGERLESAAAREALEEGGLAIEESDLTHVLTVHRLAEDQTGTWVDVFFEAKKFSGELINADPHDHSDAAWFDPQNLPQNTVPVHRAAIEAWLNGKSYTSFGWDEQQRSAA